MSSQTRPPRIVDIRRRVFEKNDLLARSLRERFSRDGVFTINLLSSPGSGKTTLLEHTLTALSADRRVGAIVGDLATDNDATRLARSGAPVHQITTGTNCHLEAQMIDAALQGWDPGDLDILFIENVGNLVCPADYDLGEQLRVVLLSVTEGEDKPLKYPPIFHSADLALVTKIDLADAVEFDRDAAHASIQAVHPGMAVLELSARTGQGMPEWLDFIRARQVQP
ncbi:MAG TPA: hydrogenase nickel incorporation protein HypB [Candidatus Dormibacteraeota bacterium]|nr:hydrogenase nickel incorporation protein HypB [Candidatus Dormibacteraeota bacterium]